MDVEVIAPPAAVSEVCAEQADGLCEPRSLADHGTQELSSGEEPAAPPSPPKPSSQAESKATGPWLTRARGARSGEACARAQV